MIINPAKYVVGVLPICNRRLSSTPLNVRTYFFIAEMISSPMYFARRWWHVRYRRLDGLAVSKETGAAELARFTSLIK